MKKIYMMPSLKVKEIKPTHILAGSDPTMSNGTTTDNDAKVSFGFDDEEENTFGKVNNTIW